MSHMQSMRSTVSSFFDTPVSGGLIPYSQASYDDSYAVRSYKKELRKAADNIAEINMDLFMIDILRELRNARS